MDRRIKFRHLEAFAAIARAKSLKRAGDALNLTQPAMSKTLKELEGLLGHSLMERGRAGVRLTPEGEVFLPHAEQALGALRTGLNSLGGAGALGVLRLGALPSVAATLMPAAVTTFRAQAPEIVVQVLEGPHRHLCDLLRAGELDLVVGRLGRPDSMAGLTFTQLYTEEVVIVAAPDHPLAGATELAQLAEALIVYPPRETAIRPLVARMMIGDGLPLFQTRIESASGAFGRAMVLGPERALWVISRGVVATDLAEGRLVALPISTGPTAGPVGVMARADDPPSPTIRRFRHAITRALVAAT